MPALATPAMDPPRRRGARHGARRAGLSRVVLLLLLLLLAVAVLAATADAARARARPAQLEHPDPLRTAAVRRLVRTREGSITAAVEDLVSNREWLLNRGDRDDTASIIKVDILETLLHHHDSSAGALRAAETPVAEGMIEDSDNADATDLWNEDGGPAGIAAYNRLAGLTQTTPNLAWGDTTTSAADQIQLLRQLALPSTLLTNAARRYQLGLMRHVVAGQNWGVSGGVPSGVSVALKNGWLPLSSDTDWEINSIGWVDGDRRNYLIAVLTTHDPGETYGIDTIEQLSADVFRSMRPAWNKPPPKPGQGFGGG